MNEDLQQSAAESAEQLSDEVTQVAKTGEAGAPEVVETDEQKNARIQAEQAEKNRAREEKRQSSIQRRMDELTADKYAERKRADELAAQNARILALLEGSKATSAQPASGEPTREQFESYEDFISARAEYRAEQKAEAAVKQALEQFTKTQQESTTKAAKETEQQKVEKQFLERRAAAEKELPDYREVIEDWEPKLPDSVVDLIVRLEDGPLITYHMAKNPALEAQFRDSPPHMHGILLGQLLATLKSSTKESAAPKPGKPVTGKVAASDGSAYTGDPEGYMAWARKNLR
jgi:hypothetical protein